MPHSEKISLKNKLEIEKLIAGGKILAGILEELVKISAPGVTGEMLDKKALELSLRSNARCSFYRFHGFPAHFCLSLNNEVVHGIPFGKVIREGDLVSLDLGIKFKGLFTDSSVTVLIPKRNSSNSKFDKVAIKNKKKLLRNTYEALKKSLPYCRQGYRLGDIGYAIQNYAEKKGYSVVKKLVGHGVGYAVHEDPYVPNYGEKNQGLKLKPGMVIAIEPMVNEGGDDVILDPKTNWTYLTKDDSLSAHFEWTIAITEKDPIVITPLSWVEKYLY